MKIYHYDSSTGAFAGTSKADPNPRRAGSFLIPAFATEIAPPSATENNLRLGLKNLKMSLSIVNLNFLNN